MSTDPQQQTRLQRLHQIADQHTEEIHDAEAREQLALDEPVCRYAAVTSEGSAESSYASNGNLLVFGSFAEMSELLAGEAAAGWLAHGRAWDLDTDWDPWGNLAVAYQVKVGRAGPEPVTVVEVDGRDDGIYLFVDQDDAQAFGEAVRRGGGSCSKWEEVVSDGESAQRLIEAERAS
jgi:hypothetical protein